MAFKQLVSPRTGTKDGLGWCLRFTQTAFGAPAWYDSAREAWDGQRGRHAGVEPPLGIAVPIWFDHFGTYGTPARYGNWGHNAVRLADGRVLTSPFYSSQLDSSGKGQAIYRSITAMCEAMPGGAKYLGWSEWMHNVQTVETSPQLKPSKPSGQKEDEDMNVIGYIRDKAKGSQGSVYALQENGRKRLIKKAEWNSLRALEGQGVKLHVAGVAAADLNAIPNA